MASTWVKFIFQFPAMNGLRPVVRVPGGAVSGILVFPPSLGAVGQWWSIEGSAIEDREPGKGLSFEVLQRRTAAGGDVGEVLLGQPQRPHRGR